MKKGKILLVSGMLVMTFVLAGCATIGLMSKGIKIKLDGTIIDYRVNIGGRDVVIPERFGVIRVTAIGEYAFDSYELTSVVIPDSVTSIGEGAFAHNRLTSVVIPDSVTSIGVSAFALNRLTSVVIPNSVTTIGHFVFYDNQLTSVVIPDSGTSIGDWAFRYNLLTSVVIPDSVTSIGDGAFANNQLTSVVIPDSVTSIGDGAFANNQLTSVVIPDSVTSIGEAAFRYNQLTNVVIPGSVTSIDWLAFAENQLTSVVIPDSVTAIVVRAFEGNQLTSITLPSGLDSTGYTPDFHASYGLFFKKQGGTYLLQDGKWTLNGVRPVYTLLIPGDGIYITAIDGKAPLSHVTSDKPETSTQALEPGWHDIEVGYNKDSIYSMGTVTFKQRYLFEESNYRITGTPQGSQILFRIERVDESK
jgi:hypothetical protein